MQYLAFVSLPNKNCISVKLNNCTMGSHFQIKCNQKQERAFQAAVAGEISAKMGKASHGKKKPKRTEQHMDHTHTNQFLNFFLRLLLSKLTSFGFAFLCNRPRFMPLSKELLSVLKGQYLSKFMCTFFVTLSFQQRSFRDEYSLFDTIVNKIIRVISKRSYGIDWCVSDL